MRRFTRILLLLGMFLAVGLVGAQEEETILYVRLECDCETDSVLDEIVSQLEANLANYEIELQIALPDTENSEYADWVDYLDIRVFHDGSETPEGDTEYYGYWFDYEIKSTSLSRTFEELSPLLNSKILFRGAINECFPPDSCDFQTNLLTAMSLYLLNRCDLIENFLRPITIERTVNGVPDYIQIYENIIRANCAILSSNYANAQEILGTTALFYLWFPEQEVVKLAWLYIQNGNPEEAISLMTKNVEYRRDEIAVTGFLPTILIETLKNRAQIYALAFDYDSAIADMDNAITVAEQYEMDNTRLAELYTIRGQIIFLLYEWDRVLENFNHAIELDPNYAPAYFQRGVLYYTMTQRENALADFEHYLELEPDGLYAEEAAQYIDSIQIELEALGG
jgi:tetratricopeptide (TPR) repeat protein